MPNLGDEFHDGWLKGILGWDLDVDIKGSTLVWSIGRTLENAFEMSKIVEGIGSG